MSELEQMAQQMASYQYQQNTQSGTDNAPSGNANDDVVDADYTEKN